MFETWRNSSQSPRKVPARPWTGCQFGAGRCLFARSGNRGATGQSDGSGKNLWKNRLPESQALTRLVRTVFPHQYRHVPWRFNFSLAKLLAQIGLARISGGLIDEPTFRLSQDERITYTQLERRRIMTDATFYAILVGSIVGLYYLVRLIF